MYIGECLFIGDTSFMIHQYHLVFRHTIRSFVHSFIPPFKYIYY